MRIFASLTHEVHINPTEVIDKLMREAVGDGCSVFERDGKYYKSCEVAHGSHSSDIDTIITKEEYEYVVSLRNVLQYLRKKSK